MSFFTHDQFRLFQQQQAAQQAQLSQGENRSRKPSSTGAAATGSSGNLAGQQARNSSLSQFNPNLNSMLLSGNSQQELLFLQQQQQAAAAARQQQLAALGGPSLSMMNSGMDLYGGIATGMGGLTANQQLALAGGSAADQLALMQSNAALFSGSSTNSMSRNMGFGEDDEEHERGNHSPSQQQASMFEMLKRQQQTQHLALVQQQAQLQAQQLKLHQIHSNAKTAMQKGVVMDFMGSGLKQPKMKNNAGLMDDEDDNQHLLVPCRARGMPMDHNAKSAHFVVPPNMPHGADLICSYDHCRNAGVKFKFCGVCQMPVAKRNFRNRHKHEDVLGKSALDDVDGLDDDKSDRSPSKKQEKRSSSSSLKRKDAPTEEASSFPLTVSNLQQLHQLQHFQQQAAMIGKDATCQLTNSKKMAEPKKPKRPSQSTESSPKTKPTSPLRRTPSPIPPKPPLKRAKVQTPPEQTEERDGKEYAKSTPPVSPPSAKGNDALQEKFQLWQTLISQRPAPEEGPQKMSKWLLQVLSTSDTSDSKDPVYNEAMARMLMSADPSVLDKMKNRAKVSSVASVSSIASSAVTVPTSNNSKKEPEEEDSKKAAAAEAMFSLLGGKANDADV